MPPTAKPGFRQRFRCYFRWCRISLLFLVLLLLGSLTYLNRVGLPEFLKARLVSELRARGVILKFTRMRLRWYHGLVAENVSLGRADDPAGPHLSIGEADLKLDRAALHKLHLQINSLVFICSPTTSGSSTIFRRFASAPESISPARWRTRRRFATGSSNGPQTSRPGFGKDNCCSS
ncbi:MAG: hypothetical protein DME21_02885 [Verrucomicrobia bacterium]|nr:MAG: hypothetical protein DME21_02885 [Verrucomicrobiota bacterium]